MLSRSLNPRSDVQIEQMRVRFNSIHPWQPTAGYKWDHHDGVGKLCDATGSHARLQSPIMEWMGYIDKDGSKINWVCEDVGTTPWMKMLETIYIEQLGASYLDAHAANKKKLPKDVLKKPAEAIERDLHKPPGERSRIFSTPYKFRGDEGNRFTLTQWITTGADGVATAPPAAVEAFKEMPDHPVIQHLTTSGRQAKTTAISVADGDASMWDIIAKASMRGKENKWYMKVLAQIDFKAQYNFVQEHTLYSVKGWIDRIRVFGVTGREQHGEEVDAADTSVYDEMDNAADVYAEVDGPSPKRPRTEP